jgi:sugar/nucleoside kinase (ribokinase family)
MNFGEAPRGNGPDLVVIGNLLTDDAVFPDGRTFMAEPGGACLYTSLSAALWDARVAVVSVRGDHYASVAIDAMLARGIDLSGVRAIEGPGLRTWLLYEAAGRRVIHHLGLPSHADVSPEPREIPTHCLEARAFHLAPMPLERQAELVRALSPRHEAALSLDPYEMVTEKNLGDWREVLAKIDAFFVSEDELLLDGVEEDPRGAVRRLAGGRLRFVAFKRGQRGGMLYDAQSDSFIEWPAVPRLTGDPTGAGDAFAGGFLAAVLAGASVQEALDQGTISVSLCLEDWGARGLMRATGDEARRRLREWLGAIG